MRTSSVPTPVITGTRTVGCSPGSPPMAELSTPRNPSKLPRTGSSPARSTLSSSSSAAWSTACPQPRPGEGGGNRGPASPHPGDGPFCDHILGVRAPPAEQAHAREPVTDPLVEHGQLAVIGAIAVPDVPSPAISVPHQDRRHPDP